MLASLSLSPILPLIFLEQRYSVLYLASSISLNFPRLYDGLMLSNPIRPNPHNLQPQPAQQLAPVALGPLNPRQ